MVDKWGWSEVLIERGPDNLSFISLCQVFRGYIYLDVILDKLRPFVSFRWDSSYVI